MSTNPAIGLSEHLSRHGGEIGKLIGSNDWENPSLGNIEDWPQSLRSSVSLCLNATFPIAVWWGEELVKIYNDSFKELLQIQHPEALGTKGAHIWSDLWNILGPSLKTVLKEGHANEASAPLTFTSGGVSETRYFTFFNSPIVDESGKTGGVFTAVSETTQTVLNLQVKERTKALEQMNEELKLSEERYFKMTEEVQDYAIILLDTEGNIVNWNKGAQKIKGYSEAEIIGKNFSIFYLEEDLKRKLPEALFLRAQQEGRAMHEGWRKRKDGSIFWGSIVITALHDDNNNIIGFTKVTRDLTERKQAEDTMRQHAAELEIKNRQLEQFAYIASHDLQEPLRKIQTFVQVLEKNIENPDARLKYFEKINSSAKRMGDLIQSVLNYSRLAKSDELRGTTDLNVILENIKSDYELLMTEKKATIKSDVLPTVHGVSLQLSQLFANLIGNALKFTEANPIITISSTILKGADAKKKNPVLDGTKNYVELIFSDNGIGFDQQYAEKIFTIFQRLNSREEFAGTGIGLALCKKIVENHDGHILARGELGKGAEFVVYLPLL